MHKDLDGKHGIGGEFFEFTQREFAGEHGAFHSEPFGKRQAFG